MPLDTLAALVTSVFDLKAVQAVTRAINANLPKDGPLGTIRPSSAQLHARPRRYYSPTPQERPLPRPVPPSLPGYGTLCDCYDRCRPPQPVSSQPSEPWTMDGPMFSHHGGPFDPPWRHLPPVAQAHCEIEVNIVRAQVDYISKGTLLDVFA